jgi:hypothetical protein
VFAAVARLAYAIVAEPVARHQYDRLWSPAPTTARLNISRARGLAQWLSMAKMTAPCEHASHIPQVTPRTNGCEECLALGVEWNELRVCLTCGHVGCCEDSEYAHALSHFNTTGHPLIAPLERGETWGWCYIHRRYFELPPESLPRRRSALAAAFARLLGR